MIEQGPTPDPRSRRFDERGIALQTIIILVVLLAIAGAVVVVIANRAAQETSRLENQDTAAVRHPHEREGLRVGGRHTLSGG